MMIYVDGEMLRDLEGLDRLISWSKESHEKVMVRCDSGVSKKCRFEYEVEFRNFVKYNQKNNGRILCIHCNHAEKYSGRNNPNTRYCFDDDLFNEIDTKEKAWVLGWIASDGHVSNRGFAIKIHKKDFTCLRKICDIIGKDLPIKFDKKRPIINFQVNSQKISKDLCKHLKITPGKKSHTVGFPDLKPELVKHFLRGLFEGDGSVAKSHLTRYPKCYIKSNSKNMRCGVLQNSLYVPKICTTHVYWSGQNSLDFLNWIYDDCGDLFLDRKYEILQGWREKGYIKYKKTIIRTGFHLSDEHKKKISMGHTGFSRTKLNLDKAREIRKLKTAGLSDRKIGEIFCVSASTISRIVRKISWKG